MSIYTRLFMVMFGIIILYANAFAAQPPYSVRVWADSSSIYGCGTAENEAMSKLDPRAKAEEKECLQVGGLPSMENASCMMCQVDCSSHSCIYFVECFQNVNCLKN